MSYPPPHQQPDPYRAQYGGPMGGPMGGPPPARVGCLRRIGGVVLIVFGVLLFLGSLLGRLTGGPVPQGARGAGYMVGFFISLALAALLVWGGIRLQYIRRRR